MPKEMNEHDFKSFKKKFHATLDDNYYTDDQAVLNRYEWITLFVYGTLKKGYPLESYLQGQRYMGMAHTVKNRYTMYQTNNKLRVNFPIIFPTLDVREQGYISGEVYKVRPWVLAQLDFIEQNGMAYHRDMVEVQMLDFRYPNKDKVWCYTYTGDVEWWKDKLLKEAILKVDRFTRKRDPNYHYYTFLPPKRPHIGK